MSPARPLAEPLRFVVGPTAAGKSAFALELAERAGVELVSLDSMLVYRGMDVGTAKPSAAERARVRHHLIDVVDPPERYDVRRYLEDVAAVRADAARRGRRLVFVGGTVFYLRALVQGLFGGPPVDLALRARLEARADAVGGEALHAELGAVDPVAAERIHPNDQKRVVRALEVWHQTGRPISRWQAQWGWGDRPAEAEPLRAVGLGAEADELEARIRRRCAAMLDAGWADEARAIRDGVGFGSTSIQALGYREVLRHADGELSRAEVEELVTLRTRQFARRQRTGLRRVEGVRWVGRDEVDEALVHLRLAAR